MTVHNSAGSQLNEFTTVDNKRLGDFLLQRLRQCGWIDKLEEIYDQILEETKDQNVTESEILAKLNARAKPLIPNTVKRDFKEKMKEFSGAPRLANDPNADDQSREDELSQRIQVKIHIKIKKNPEE